MKKVTVREESAMKKVTVRKAGSVRLASVATAIYCSWCC